VSVVRSIYERAQTPEEIHGRLLVAYAAAVHARQEVVARSARQGRFNVRPEAEKAFARICRKHLPPSLERFAAEVAEREAGARAAPAPPRSHDPHATVPRRERRGTQPKGAACHPSLPRRRA
jgi:hypothetical protein